MARHAPPLHRSRSPFRGARPAHVRLSALVSLVLATSVGGVLGQDPPSWFRVLDPHVDPVCRAIQAQHPELRQKPRVVLGTAHELDGGPSATDISDCGLEDCPRVGVSDPTTGQFAASLEPDPDGWVQFGHGRAQHWLNIKLGDGLFCFDVRLSRRTNLDGGMIYRTPPGPWRPGAEPLIREPYSGPNPPDRRDGGSP